MSYQQLIVELSQAEVEACEDLLTELGALAITLEDAKEDPLFEPKVGSTPIWQNTKLTALFEAASDLTPVQQSLKEHLDPKSFATLNIEKVPEKDWVRASLDQFKPQYFSDKLIICPSWVDLDLETIRKKTHHEPVIVWLDPGLAFGTGTHPSTQLCLQWLANHSVKDKIVMDYGCGSGILGIAALKLGAKKLIAIDHDPQALWSTSENAKLNQIDDAAILCTSPENLHLTEKVDLILANILANPLIELAPKFKQMLAPRGEMVLAGILASQQESVIRAYADEMHHFIVESEISLPETKDRVTDSYEDAWVCIQSIKKA